MANILSMDKQINVIGALAEGNSIRAIERMTGVNRNTIMSLGLRAPRKAVQAYIASEYRKEQQDDAS
jgi:hypothetical protein